MPQIPYRANLSSAVFPMTLADAGRSVIVPQADQNFDRRVDPAGEQTDAGIPQAIYMQNVIPTVNGFQSVGWFQRQPIPPRSGGAPGSATIQKTFVLEGTVIAPRSGSGGYLDVISNDIDCSLTWAYNAGATPVCGAPIEPSIAAVRGTYYYCDQTDIFTFTINAGTKQLTFINVTASALGVIVSDIRYICSSYNYLILLMNDGTIRWSSTTTPLDFVPSLVTGSGVETPGQTIDPQFLVEHPDGFLIFGTYGVIFVRYTGNSRYPWKFTPVTNSGGYSFPYQVYGGSSERTTYCIDTGNKVRIIADGAAQLVAPEVSSYFEREPRHDTFNYSTNVFSYEEFFNIKKIFYILDRYLVISVIQANTAAGAYSIIYDTLLQRYGKLKIDHNYVVSSPARVTYIGRFAVDDDTYNLGLDIYNTDYTFEGVLLLGKFQYVRDRFLQLEEIAIESAKNIAIGSPQNLSVVLFPSFDGKNFTTPVVLSPTITANLATVNLHKTALNHSIMLKGAFDVNTLALVFNTTGHR